MIPLSGYVYFDDSFEFLDGEIGRKLFVVCCDSPREPDAVIVARTTSKAKSERTYGCYTNQHPPCFYLPDEENCLDGETWVLFDYVSTYDSSILSRWTPVCKLGIPQTAALLLCGSSSEYIERWASRALNEWGRRLAGV